jgi:iron complex outermembrane receptor protein
MKKIYLGTASVVACIAPLTSAANANAASEPVNAFYLTAASSAAMQPVAAAEAAAPAAGGTEETELESVGQSDDIVVTANKRAQNLQDVSLSITAISGDDLADRQITDMTDFAAEVPNLTVTTQLGRAVISIRGMGQASPLNGRDPSVALHLDGAVISQAAAQLGAFFDLERIEVLRGPQGTLYGRNATGGVVNLVSNKPSRDAGGYIRATIGNYDAVGVEGAITGPIAGDALLGRLSVRTEDRAGTGINEMSGTDINDTNTRAVRGQLQARPAEGLTMLLAAEYYTESDANYVSTHVAAGYPNPGHPALVQRGADLSPNPRNIRSESEASNTRETWSVTGTIDWDISDSFGIRSLTNYRELINDQIYDFDASPVVTHTINNNYQESQQFSEELQFTYEANERLNTMLTFFYFKEHYAGDSVIGINPIRTAPPSVQRFVTRFSGDVDIESWAVFGNAVYDLSSTLLLDVGARYTSETREGNTVTFSGGSSRPYNTGATSTDFSPKITVEYRPFDGLMTYATYSEGFKSGVIPIGSPNPIVKPERVKNYELGFKSEIWDRLLLFNTSFFYNDYTDLQVSKGQASVADAASVSLLLENAASAVTQGFETELVLTPNRGLSFDMSLGYLDARFKDYVTVSTLDLPNAPLRDLQGNVLPNAPKWTARVAAHYEHPLSNGATLSFNAGASYKSKMFFSAFEEKRLSRDAMTLFDANIRYADADNRFSANLWTKNISDNQHYQVIFLNSTSRQLLGQLAEPRTYGVTFGYNF